jgi:hypothetical protein
MIAFILLTVSVVAFSQFGMYYWRATIAAAASLPISDRVRAAAGVSTRALNPGDFAHLVSLCALTEHLGRKSHSWLAVRGYFFVVEQAARLMPAVAKWAHAEMAMCTNYMAAALEAQFEHTLQCAAQTRNM